MILNPMETIELNDDTLFLLRKGMVLRKKHLKLLFGNYVTDITYPEYIKKVYGSSYTGIDNDNIIVPKYNIQSFKLGSKRIYDFFIQDPDQILPASIINSLSAMEVRAAFFSGYLKHDTRGYYFTKNDRAMMEVMK